MALVFDVQSAQMFIPELKALGCLWRFKAQLLAYALAQALFMHVSQGLRIDLGRDGARVQAFKEVDSTLALSAAEPAKLLVAYVQHIAVFALMACARVVHRNGSVSYTHLDVYKRQKEVNAHKHLQVKSSGQPRDQGSSGGCARSGASDAGRAAGAPAETRPQRGI